MRARIYTHTSVLGGCEDEEFREPSRRLLDAFEHGELTLVLSELTIRVLEGGPEAVRTVLGRVPGEQIEALALSPEAEELASAYIADGAIGGACGQMLCTLPWLRWPASMSSSAGTPSTSWT